MQIVDSKTANYIDLFQKSQQIGRLYFAISNGSEKTFEIYLLPAGIKATKRNLTSDEVVRVYAGGEWLYRGQFIECFDKIVGKKKMEQVARRTCEEAEKVRKKNHDDCQVVMLMKDYEPVSL